MLYFITFCATFVVIKYAVIRKTAPPNTLSHSTVISQRLLPKVYEMFEKVRGCEQQLNLPATRRQHTHLTFNVDVIKVTLVHTVHVTQLKC